MRSNEIRLALPIPSIYFLVGTMEIKLSKMIIYITLFYYIIVTFHSSKGLWSYGTGLTTKGVLWGISLSRVRNTLDAIVLERVLDNGNMLVTQSPSSLSECA